MVQKVRHQLCGAGPGTHSNHLDLVRMEREGRWRRRRARSLLVAPGPRRHGPARIRCAMVPQGREEGRQWSSRQGQSRKGSATPLWRGSAAEGRWLAEEGAGAADAPLGSPRRHGPARHAVRTQLRLATPRARGRPDLAKLEEACHGTSRARAAELQQALPVAAQGGGGGHHHGGVAAAPPVLGAGVPSPPRHCRRSSGLARPRRLHRRAAPHQPSRTGLRHQGSKGGQREGAARTPPAACRRRDRALRPPLPPRREQRMEGGGTCRRSRRVERPLAGKEGRLRGACAPLGCGHGLHSHVASAPPQRRVRPARAPSPATTAGLAAGCRGRRTARRALPRPASPRATSSRGAGRGGCELQGAPAAAAASSRGRGRQSPVGRGGGGKL
ncbi:hypothetical protein PVAP13_5KG362407 [Panicum virgatum]|uniref:Uncharacterized protein n=1 Tax=Panicum virgatum TaxID=38727 RepID=A0A8T0SPS9_PANVG|nr:hypothetical protein PVAP13_5KG362407 [Panicum virgatum]